MRAARVAMVALAALAAAASVLLLASRLQATAGPPAAQAHGPRRLALATVVSTADFVVGAAVLLHSWRRHTPRDVRGSVDAHALVVADNVPQHALAALERVGWTLHRVSALKKLRKDSNENTRRNAINFTKMRLWSAETNLTQYDQVLYIDSDALMIGEMHSLLRRRYLPFSAILSASSRFNGGVFTYHPSNETFARLLDLFLSDKYPVRTGGDQDLLNYVFDPKKAGVIPRYYNGITSTAWVDMRTANLLHYTGKSKPWWVESVPCRGWHKKPVAVDAVTSQCDADKLWCMANKRMKNVDREDRLALAWWHSFLELADEYPDLDLLQFLPKSKNCTVCKQRKK
eukprot:TRINITY_DN7325_c0_g1_i1.p1 TRINITY_DN7325_c0_g1~~TRINITY_DN7325_c0_g1_i1.p1  ORF type:complete len:344 (-),score=111.33 TRINITY_DN7325_c0_g1_i1:22-1053(-)